MAKKINFGEVSGIKEGDIFKGRREVMSAGLHRVIQKGIDADKEEGAAAVVLSGSYNDQDNDKGDVIIYTGAGGRDKNGRQCEDQEWTSHDNAALIKSCDRGLLIRVIIGHKHKSSISPTEGYVYAGLYYVDSYWNDVEPFDNGQFKMCKYKLVYSGSSSKRSSPEEIELDHSIKDKKHKISTVIRVVRNTKIALSVKKMYNFKCQVCNTTIKTKSGYYAEGAHIRPLGHPHNGDDSLSNILCLCPNHHVMLDKGVISVNNNYTLLGEGVEKLNTLPKHRLNSENLKYHRKCHGFLE